jgi:hypothetical protein
LPADQRSTVFCSTSKKVKSFHTVPRANQDYRSTQHSLLASSRSSPIISNISVMRSGNEASYSATRELHSSMSLRTLRPLFAERILGKIPFPNPILAHCKTYDEEYEISFQASLRHLTGRYKCCPLFHKWHARARALPGHFLPLNRSCPLAWTFLDWVESDGEFPWLNYFFTAKRGFFCEDPVLVFDMAEVRDHILLPTWIDKLDYLLSPSKHEFSNERQPYSCSRETNQSQDALLVWLFLSWRCSTSSVSHKLVHYALTALR